MILEALAPPLLEALEARNIAVLPLDGMRAGQRTRAPPQPHPRGKGERDQYAECDRGENEDRDQEQDRETAGEQSLYQRHKGMILRRPCSSNRVGSLKRTALFIAALAVSANLPGLDAGAWLGLMVPAGTPKVAVDRLASAMETAMQGGDMRERLFSVRRPQSAACALRRDHSEGQHQARLKSSRRHGDGRV